MSAAGRALSKALDKPEDWSVPDEYVIKHIPSGMGFWISNGGFFFDGTAFENTPKCLGRIERHWLYFKAMKMVRRAAKEERAKTQKEVVEKFTKDKQ